MEGWLCPLFLKEGVIFFLRLHAPNGVARVIYLKGFVFARNKVTKQSRKPGSPLSFQLPLRGMRAKVKYHALAMTILWELTVTLRPSKGEPVGGQEDLQV